MADNCPRCNGKGLVRVKTADGEKFVTCPNCGGSGKAK